MDSFHNYLKKQLLEYVKAERKKGIPLKQIEKVLLDAGHQKNAVDEVFSELEKEEAGMAPEKHKEEVENDLISMIKSGFTQFMAQLNKKEVSEAKKDFKKSDTDELVKEVIEEAEVIEEKTVLESVAFFVYLIIMALIMLFTAGSTDAEIIKVIIGFSPAIINAFVSFLSINLSDNVPLYMFIPLLIVSGFYAIGRFTGMSLFDGMDIESLSVVNFLFSFAFNVLLSYIRFIKPNNMKRQVVEIPKYNYTKKSATIKPSLKQNKPTHSHNTKKKVHRKEIKDLKKEFNL